MLTINGRVRLARRWWHSPETGSVAPADEQRDPQGATVTPGVSEMCCRENRSISGFDQAAVNLARTAQLKLSGEQLRQTIAGFPRQPLRNFSGG